MLRSTFKYGNFHVKKSCHDSSDLVAVATFHVFEEEHPSQKYNVTKKMSLISTTASNKTIELTAAAVGAVERQHAHLQSFVEAFLQHI
jgi:hypothetical protein